MDEVPFAVVADAHDHPAEAARIVGRISRQLGREQALVDHALSVMRLLRPEVRRNAFLVGEIDAFLALVERRKAAR